MTKKQKIIFKWTAYFILLIILNISLIFGTVFIVQDEHLNGLKAIFGCWAWTAGIKEFELELKNLKKGNGMENKETEKEEEIEI